LSTDPTLPALELTGERIAEAMARVEKVACRPGDERRLALPYDVASALATCTPKGRCRVGGTRRVIVATAGGMSGAICTAARGACGGSATEH
jgi:hypothetical protein